MFERFNEIELLFELFVFFAYFRIRPLHLFVILQFEDEFVVISFQIGQFAHCGKLSSGEIRHEKNALFRRRKNRKTDAAEIDDKAPGREREKNARNEEEQSEDEFGKSE